MNIRLLMSTTILHLTIFNSTGMMGHQLRGRPCDRHWVTDGGGSSGAASLTGSTNTARIALSTGLLQTAVGHKRALAAPRCRVHRGGQSEESGSGVGDRGSLWEMEPQALEGRTQSGVLRRRQDSERHEGVTVSCAAGVWHAIRDMGRMELKR